MGEGELSLLSLLDEKHPKLQAGKVTTEPLLEVLPFSCWCTHYFPAFPISSLVKSLMPGRMESFSIHRNNWWIFLPFLIGLLRISHTLPYRISYWRRRKKTFSYLCVFTSASLSGGLILAIPPPPLLCLPKCLAHAKYITNEYWLSDSTQYIVWKFIRNAKSIFSCLLCSVEFDLSA